MTSKFVMEKGTGEVKVAYEQVVEAGATACICKIGAKNECAVGSVRGPCVCIVV